jgi:short-subunit dehydrogenase
VRAWISHSDVTAHASGAAGRVFTVASADAEMKRSVLVTGASSGIGLATALRLAETGFEVVGLVSDGEERAELERCARDRSLRLDCIELDLGDASARAGAVAELPVWGLINNAGYMNAGLLRDVALEDARRQLEVMVLAPLDLARQVLPTMVRRGQGRIVNVTSGASRGATPLSGWYQACKSALRELNDALRLELHGTGVDVIDIEPGGFRTEIWSRAKAELEERQSHSLRPESYERLLRAMPAAQSRMRDPDDVAAAILDVLTVGQPPAHRRVGAEAMLVRALSDLVPDALSDRLVARLVKRIP